MMTTTRMTKTTAPDAFDKNPSRSFQALAASCLSVAPFHLAMAASCLSLALAASCLSLALAASCLSLALAASCLSIAP